MPRVGQQELRNAPPILTIAGQPESDEVSYQPAGACREVFTRRASELLLEGPSGTGKTRALLEKLSLCAKRYPGMRGLICRKIRAAITQSCQVEFERAVLVESDQVRWHDGDQEYRYPNGSVIVVAGLDDPQKIKSTQFDLVYVNEATELTLNDWEILTTRNRNGIMPYQQIIADCNPGDPTHWLNLRCRDGQTERYCSKHEDNPRYFDQSTMTWTPVGMAYLATLDALTGARYQHLRLGVWAAAEGQYFSDWDPAKHVCEPFDLPAHWTRWVAVDYGFADPWCVLWAARADDARRTIYLYRELYLTGYRDEQQADLLREKSKGERIARYYGDPSMFNRRTEQNKLSIALVYRQHGVPLLPAVNKRIPGWQAVLRTMASERGPSTTSESPRLQVFSSCKNLIRTIPQMVHDPLDNEDVADKIRGRKTEDHACDALRYLLTMETVPVGRRHQFPMTIAG
mgnify:FL=1